MIRWIRGLLEDDLNARVALALTGTVFVALGSWLMLASRGTLSPSAMSVAYILASAFLGGFLIWKAFLAEDRFAARVLMSWWLLPIGIIALLVGRPISVLIGALRKRAR
jgi:cytochrome bd-type quinol oxidase subunit 2